MIALPPIQSALRRAGLERLAEALPHQYAEVLHRGHGKIGEWHARLRTLPSVPPTQVRLDGDAVGVGSADSVDEAMRARIETNLRAFHPWRKGPFEIHGVAIDSEWRSNLKWDRLARHVTPLNDRVVLDVGCGNGYYGWRMLGQGARLVIGIDPTWIYLAQFLAVRHFLGDTNRLFVLPFGIEDLPPRLRGFDTVLSMGVLYHRRSPMDHLLELRDCLKPGGELVLETLVIEGAPGEILVPEGRYAKMRNLWFIPSVPTLEGWLRRCGYANVRTVDVTATTVEEQRATDWMSFESLAAFLDPHDASKTLEGHPAPLRAMVIANG